ncbi:preprotein translocase subunit YajC [Falsarthrobacter nasiphocae]|uniref:Preprotein translocase subunit YajC n=1 Tax=Falsarthrobacter nasiphocae TaxID=189863 RepID=A0AAE3YGU1_9MICC|nr:preprotein translocase subunit YajC [Falsarthrobacter nasiphocae]MDR6892965.1 preprotein translocase subunit YajC [Falsarthrobacter nasiphocae]
MSPSLSLPLGADAAFNPGSLFLPALLVLFLLFTVMRFRKQQKEVGERRAQVVAGARVMSTSGIFGTVVSRNDAENTALVEISPGVEVTMHIGALAPAPETAPAAEDATTAPADGDGLVEPAPVDAAASGEAATPSSAYRHPGSQAEAGFTEPGTPGAGSAGSTSAETRPEAGEQR